MRLKYLILEVPSASWKNIWLSPVLVTAQAYLAHLVTMATESIIVYSKTVSNDTQVMTPCAQYPLAHLVLFRTNKLHIPCGIFVGAYTQAIISTQNTWSYQDTKNMLSSHIFYFFFLLLITCIEKAIGHKTSASVLF